LTRDGAGHAISTENARADDPAEVIDRAGGGEGSTRAIGARASTGLRISDRVNSNDQGRRIGVARRARAQ
jgi:hypothetical protein